MFSGQMKYDSAPCRTLVTVCLMALALVMAGCGGEDNSKDAATGADTAEQATSEAMVPGGDLTAEPDSFPIVRPMSPPEGTLSSPTGTTETAPTRITSDTGDQPTNSAASSPFHRPQSQNSPDDGTFSLQLGSFSSAGNADRQANRIRNMGYAPTVEVATLGGQTYHRVVLRGLADRDEAERLGEHIHSQLGITYLIRQK